MPSTRKPAAKKPSTRKKTSKASPKRTRSSKASRAGGPLEKVARKIGSTLGEMAVRTGIIKPGGGEPSAE